MDIAWQSILLLVAFASLILIGVPMALVSGALAVILALTLFGVDSLFLIANRTYELLNSYAFVAVPMFVLMASVLEQTGMARDIYRALHVWTSRLKGGVAVVTTIIGVILGASSGIIGGEIVLLGLVALPQMFRLGYNRRLAIGTVCASGSLGTMIPPSIVLVVYGITVNVSIGQLFVAAVVPALLMVGSYIAYILIRCHMNPEMGPSEMGEGEESLSTAEKLALLKSIILPLLVAFSVLGSIYGGIASITEAASLGAAGVMASAWLRGEMSWQLISTALVRTLSICGMILWLIFGTNSLVGVYSLMGGVSFLQSILTSLPFDPLVVILCMMGVFVLLGLLMDWVGIMFLTLPIFIPTVQALGYDPIWFGILFNLCMQISYMTPPFGPCAFYLKSVANDLELEEIFKSFIPFILMNLIIVILVLLFPSIALWLPKAIYLS